MIAILKNEAGYQNGNCVIYKEGYKKIAGL